ncbi:unnamed protein product [Prorocentrum cordatum]|uniref:Uncharacterized protein n=1 Tax=Prorocentrum cordatum TaxID=2364126 RepID=A0ABN9TQS9_9DINO|nr:unnamed protein product [Polarella glacialis]
MRCQREQCPEPVRPKIETTLLGCLAGRPHPSSQPGDSQPPASPASHAEARPSGPGVSQAARTTPPSTPRARPRVPSSPPPLRREDEEPPLLLGLKQNCSKQVRLVLEADPEAAQLPFLQPRFEWPLCAAIRLGCSKDIVRLLTENGAKVDVENVDGQSPLQLLSSRAGTDVISAPLVDLLEMPGFTEWAEWMLESTAQYELDVATALLIAGADPGACHGAPPGGHCSSLELAQRAGKGHLVGLYGARGHVLTV